jgi:hypothetical protein
VADGGSLRSFAQERMHKEFSRGGVHPPGKVARAVAHRSITMTGRRMSSLATAVFQYGREARHPTMDPVRFL